MCREFSVFAKENVFSSLPGCTSFKQDSIEKHLKSAAHHASQQASAARQVLEHVICEAAGSVERGRDGGFKGEVRTINDRNICERRSCRKNNGKSPTSKFVSGEEKRPSEVQRVSRGWCLPGATHSSADLTWIRKSLEIQAPELSEPESVELELGSCCSDLDKQVSDKICWTRKRQFEIPFRL